MALTLEERVAKLEKTQFRWVTLGMAVALAFGILGISKWRSIPEEVDAKVKEQVRKQVEDKVGPQVLVEIEQSRRKAVADAQLADVAADDIKRRATTLPSFATAADLAELKKNTYFWIGNCFESLGDVIATWLPGVSVDNAEEIRRQQLQHSKDARATLNGQ
jgi:hypothetical protein